MRQYLGSRTSSGWVVGHIRDVPVVFAPSWFLIAILLGVLVAPTLTRLVPGTSPVMTTLAAASVPLMLLISVFAHELCHGLIGHAVGSPPRQYVLTLWGGHTQFATALPTPGKAALVSLAGPSANILLAGAAYLAQGLISQPLVLVVLQISWLSNAVVAAFNLLPGLPLDGGQVLEAIVWRLSGNRISGTIVAGWGGRVVVIALVAIMLLRPLLLGHSPSILTAVWVVALGAYLWFGSTAAINSAKARRRAAGLDLNALARPASGMRAETMLSQLGQLGQLLGAYGDVVLFDEQQRVCGLLDPGAVAHVPAERVATTPLSAVAVHLPAEAAVTQTFGADAVGEAAQAARHSRLLVLLTHGQVQGVLPVARLEEALGGRRRRSGAA